MALVLVLVALVPVAALVTAANGCGTGYVTPGTPTESKG